MIYETTSRSTNREDMSYKAQLYQSLGTPEYFLYDPTADYLRPPLQGWRLVGAGYQPIEPDAQGRLACQQLALWLSLDGRDLVLHDSQSGHQLLTEAEDQRAAYEREHNARQRERAAYEAELDELRQKLKERGSM